MNPANDRESILNVAMLCPVCELCYSQMLNNSYY